MALRDLRAADVAPYVQAFADDPQLAFMLGFESAPTTADARRLRRREPRDRAAGRAVRLAIADRSQDAFLGMMLLHGFDWTHERAECGFLVVPGARGRGVALEALRLMVAWAFAGLGLARVGMATLPDNAATLRLAERAGFAREGVLRAYTLEHGVRRDNVLLSALPGDPAWA